MSTRKLQPPLHMLLKTPVLRSMGAGGGQGTKNTQVKELCVDRLGVEECPRKCLWVEDWRVGIEINKSKIYGWMVRTGTWKNALENAYV